jgi:RNA polymerase sigma factor (sigma-70 family)
MNSIPCSALSETDLLAACRLGTPRAQRVLYDRLAPRMMALCLRYLRHTEDAEEVLMRGFVKVFEALTQYRHEGSLEGWVRRIMVNMALMYLRERRRQALTLDLTDFYCQVPVAPSVEATLATADLLRLVQALPTGCRTVFNLYAIEGYAHAEIAALLGITESTSKSQLARARQRLQQQVGAAGAATSTLTYTYNYAA